MLQLTPVFCRLNSHSISVALGDSYAAGRPRHVDILSYQRERHPKVNISDCRALRLTVRESRFSL